MYSLHARNVQRHKRERQLHCLSCWENFADRQYVQRCLRSYYLQRRLHRPHRRPVRRVPSRKVQRNDRKRRVRPVLAREILDSDGRDEYRDVRQMSS